jgi:hypothetical protein
MGIEKRQKKAPHRVPGERLSQKPITSWVCDWGFMISDWLIQFTSHESLIKNEDHFTSQCGFFSL